MFLWFRLSVLPGNPSLPTYPTGVSLNDVSSIMLVPIHPIIMLLFLKPHNTVVAPYPHLCFLQFQLLMVNSDPKILNGKFQKQTIPKF